MVALLAHDSLPCGDGEPELRHLSKFWGPVYVRFIYSYGYWAKKKFKNTHKKQHITKHGINYAYDEIRAQ